MKIRFERYIDLLVAASLTVGIVFVAVVLISAVVVAISDADLKTVDHGNHQWVVKIHGDTFIHHPECSYCLEALVYEAEKALEYDENNQDRQRRLDTLKKELNQDLEEFGLDLIP